MWALWLCCGLWACTQRGGKPSVAEPPSKTDSALKAESTPPGEDETLLPLPENFDFQGHRGARGLLP
ncbi:MAG: hypothetical protein RMM53_12105, partial [Bacteroidia bacterium]|nr:hypothetical protein [Bacteroidia bacterium]MDW8334949.1 hypothetical protein [Bacteroidia bacterium]